MSEPKRTAKRPANHLPANHLIDEISPYLQQHAHNPVDWYPWGEAAFARARQENRPVFLSIGYSTCHWCHVMERESFEDEQVAAALNSGFVCIKVDREERPDIDAVYMAVCQRLTGGGGWPLTVFMTPDQQPFFAGTYFPKQARYGQRGLLELLELISRAWQSDQAGIAAAGQRIAASFAEATSEAMAEGPAETPLSRAAVLRGAAQLAELHDPAWGGFSPAPKFPTPHHLIFLLRCHLLGVGREPLLMVERTLKAMYRGGIFDHIGGGFSRYSTDEKWLAPHFEKMLYDNALLSLAYTEAFQVTGNPLYRGVAEKTLAWVGREMTAPEGGFYSAQDADSQGEEGKYYTFTPQEVLDLLGEQGRDLCERYDITPAGNFEGKSIPNLIHQESALPDEATQGLLDRLYLYRLERYPLHKDDKALTAWNAMMIAAYAKAYRVFGQPEYLRAAERAHAFVGRQLSQPDGSLKVSFRNGQAQGQGLLDDYAYLAWACLELYESTFQLDYLEQAQALLSRLLEQFAGPGQGFYLAAADAGPLLFRPRDFYDGATPSGNSVAAWCLARLAALTGQASWQSAAERQLAAFGSWFAEHPAAVNFALTALMLVVYPSQELVCCLAQEEEKLPLALRLGSFPHPQAAVLAKAVPDQDGLAALAPFTLAHGFPDQGVTYYLCRNRHCELPERDFAAIRDKLLAAGGSGKK